MDRRAVNGLQRPVPSPATHAPFNVSQVLAHALDLQKTLTGVLINCKTGGLAARDRDPAQPGKRRADPAGGARRPGPDRKLDEVRDRSGEGIIGKILERGETLIVPKIADEPRLIDRLGGIYDPEQPYVATPIRMVQRIIGVLAAQPDDRLPGDARRRARFLETIANLVGQVVRLSWNMAEERRHLVSERNRLLQEVRNQYGFDNIIGHSPVMKRASSRSGPWRSGPRRS